MAKYIIYNSNGLIIRHGDCPDGLEMTQVMNDEEFILVEPYRENIYIDPLTSSIVDKTSMPSKV